MPTTSSARAPPADTAEDDDDDLPPPYTPAPNVGLGEETIGLGPQRPFQQSHPQPFPQHYAQPHPYSHPPLPPAQPLQSTPTGLAPWQTQQQYYQRPNGGGGLIGSLMDTFRDIADAVTGAHDERWVALPAANTAAYATPGPHPSANPLYAPPPGPPGQGHQRPPLPPRRPASTPPGASPTIPDDGSPTRTPVPGHPLLRDGHLLVYPRDYLCDKCNNTGYKNYDPSHPCRKCWEKYSKLYTGAITYTTWSSSGNDPRMQRPLPKFVPPHLSGHGPGRSSGSVYGHHSRSVSHPHHSHPQGSGASYYVLNPLNPYDTTSPVPHAIAVSPGDPRLGGRLCHRCGGAGVRTVLLIDETTCDYCGGTGRVWT